MSSGKINKNCRSGLCMNKPLCEGCVIALKESKNMTTCIACGKTFPMGILHDCTRPCDRCTKVTQKMLMYEEVMEVILLHLRDLDVKIPENVDSKNITMDLIKRALNNE